MCRSVRMSLTIGVVWLSAPNAKALVEIPAVWSLHVILQVWVSRNVFHRLIENSLLFLWCECECVELCDLAVDAKLFRVNPACAPP